MSENAFSSTKRRYAQFYIYIRPKSGYHRSRNGCIDYKIHENETTADVNQKVLKR